MRVQFDHFTLESANKPQMIKQHYSPDIYHCIIHSFIL